MGALAAAGQWVNVVVAPRGDFLNHLAWGRRFLAREFLYAGGTNLPYLPLWAALWAPLARLGPSWAAACAYPLGLTALGLVLRALDRLARPTGGDPAVRFWTGTLAVVLVSRYLVRDLFDCGPNLVVLALAWLGLELWIEGRPHAGGALLGFAIALKMTPAIYLPLLAARREWRMAGATVLAAATFTLAPALWLGPALHASHLRAWAAFAARGLEAEPDRGVLGPDSVIDISLRPALGRLAGAAHAGAAATALTVRGGLLLLALGVAWGLRAGGGPDDPRTPWDLAALAVLALLLSPITWRQHAVAALPAFYLLARRGLLQRRLEPALWAALAFHVLTVLLLSRGLAGREVSLLLHRFSVHTVSLLALLAALLWARGNRPPLTPAR